MWTRSPIEEPAPITAVNCSHDSGESEKEFQARIVKLAKENGWLVYHTRDSRGSQEGYPDLTMARRARIVFAELKVKGRKLTKAQDEWLNVLEECPGAEAHLWTPGCWSEIEKVLK